MANRTSSSWAESEGKCPRFRNRFPRNGNEEEINAQRCICYGLRVCSVQQCVCMCEEATCSQCNLAPSLPLQLHRRPPPPPS